ncbi:L-lactate utilization protein LutB [Bosea sp. OAE506]|uniref:hypothetical protein n=1 Tax=Bosea sp. OAE506 TaxID=2663870 RepID=UPI00178B7304
MQPLKGILAAALFVPLASAAGASLSIDQRNAVDHFAQVSVLSDRCQEYYANDLQLSAMIKRHRIDMERTEVVEFRQARYRHHMDAMDASGETVGCLSGWNMYGPGGKSVPGLLKRRS